MSDPQSNPESAAERPQIENPFAAPAEQPSADEARPSVEPPVEPTSAQPQQAPVTAPPMWMPPGSNPPPGSPFHPERPKSRLFLKVVAGVAAAGVIALSSAVAGGVVGAAVVDKHPVNTTTTTVNAAPAIDRSSLADIAAKVNPSVVSITTASGEGSGVIYSADGYIVTNNHVVATAGGDTVTVTFSDGSKASATIVGTDAKYDLAVIKANKTGLTPAKFGKISNVRVADTVLAIGSPLGLEGSVTEGIISAEDRIIRVQGSSMSGLLQTDAPINPGNSGGALVNTNGEVIGINSSIATNGSSEGNIGIGFAIPSDRAVTVADQLIKGKKVSHPYLGVQAVDNSAGGATMAQVVAGGAAEKAGLKTGDVITKFGDVTINGADDLVSAVQSHSAGDHVTVTYKRDGATNTATVTLASAS
jgi:putative serine protease PepD